MIDIKQELQNYPPIDVKGLAQSQPNLPDNIKNSIILYNKALESMRSNSEDIAIIELKKAIAINPDFHEAINLLGLCYCIINDYAKASEMFQRVIAAEHNSIKAKEYLNSLDSYSGNGNSTDMMKKNSKKDAMAAGKQNKARQNKITAYFDGWKAGFLKCAAGFIAGILVMAVFNMLNKPAVDDYISTSSDMDNTNAAAEENLNENDETRYKELENRCNNLQSSLDAANQEIDYFNNVRKLFEIENLASSNKYEEAAEMLVLLKTIEFKDIEKRKFDRLYEQVIPKAVSNIFNEGYKLYNSMKYQEAIEKLTKIQVYGIDVPYMDRVLYYIGKSYMSLDDSRNALITFESVVKNFPESVYAGYSNNWINQLKGRP